MLNNSGGSSWPQADRYWPTLSAVLILFALNHFTAALVDGYSSQHRVQRIAIREYSSCRTCRAYFYSVLSRLPDGLDGYDGIEPFVAVIEKVCEEPTFKTKFSRECQKLAMYAPSSYHAWLLIRDNPRLLDKVQGMCHMADLCFHRQLLDPPSADEAGGRENDEDGEGHRKRPHRPTARGDRGENADRIIEYGEQKSRALSTNEAYASDDAPEPTARLSRLRRKVKSLPTRSRNQVDLN